MKNKTLAWILVIGLLLTSTMGTITAVKLYRLKGKYNEIFSYYTTCSEMLETVRKDGPEYFEAYDEDSLLIKERY